MKKAKKIVIVLIVFVILAGMIAGLIISKNWTIRFKSELDTFFGKGNWQCVSQESKKSIIYKKHRSSRSNPGLSEDVPGKYQNWDIEFTNRNGEKEIWSITNHTLKINHDNYGWFNPKRYSEKQALTLELMDISFGAAGDEIREEIIRSELSEEEAGCMEVIISYPIGNTKPDFLDELREQDWFTINEASAGDYLSSNLRDFYIKIRVYDYRLEKLTAAQQRHVLDSMTALEKKLLEKYGTDASFVLNFDQDHYVEYRDGQKQ